MLALRLKAQQWLQGIFFGWWVLGASMAIQVLTAGFTLQAFGAYIAVMQEEFGWSKTAFAAAFVIQQAAGGFLGPVIGWLLGKYGPRQIIRIGLVIFAFGVMALSLVNSLINLYLCVVVIALGASLAGFLPLNTVAVQWFKRWRSTALALMQTGISLGGFLVPLVAWSLELHGWRMTALITGILVLLAGLPLSYLIGNQPEDYGLKPDGEFDPETLEPENDPQDFTVKEALKTPAFWLISFGHGLALAVVFSILAHLVVFLTSELSFSLKLAGSIIALMTAASILGQLAGGVLGDRFDKRLLATLAMLGHASALIMLAFGDTLFWVSAASVIHGVSWGIRGPIMTSIRADYFGRQYFGQIMGYSSVIVTFGITLGPLIVGRLADTLGSYQMSFIVLAGMALLGSVFFIFSTPPKHVPFRPD